MTELELQQYLLREYPQENARCEWKEFKNLKNSFCGDEKDDVISYVSAIANMEGGHLVNRHFKAYFQRTTSHSSIGSIQTNGTVYLPVVRRIIH